MPGSVPCSDFYALQSQGGHRTAQGARIYHLCHCFLLWTNYFIFILDFLAVDKQQKKAAMILTSQP